MQRKKVLWVAALTLVASVALGIRLVGLDAEPFWLDEVCTKDFNAGTLASVVRTYAADVHPPLYGILLHLWGTVVGTSEQALRGYSAAFSFVSLLCAVWLVRDVTGDGWMALAAGLMLAVNPLDIWHARDARMYAQAACLATMAACVLWRWLQRKGVTSPPRRLAAAYGLLAILLLYTHYLASILLGSQVLAVLLLFSVRRRWRDAAYLLAAAAAAFASFVPWAIFVLRFRPSLSSVVTQVGWIPKPHGFDVFAYLNHEFFIGFARAPGTAAYWFPVVTGGLLAVALVAALSKAPAPAGSPVLHPNEGLTLMLWLTLGPALIAAVISSLWQPVYFPPRFSLFCLAPGVAALVVMLGNVRSPLRTVLIAAITVLMATGAAWQAAAPTKDGLREMTRLAARFGEPAFALLLPSPNSILVHYYLPHAGLQIFREEFGPRLRPETPTLVWVCLQDGQLPPQDSCEGKLVAWLATTGPYRRLGGADGYAVYELHARALPPARSNEALE